MIMAILLQTAGLSVPVIDHTKAVTVRPISRDVIMCASPNALPLARLAAKSVGRGGPSYGFEQLITAGGCIMTLNTDPLLADFQEEVSWAGALQPPHMLHGVIRVVRVRFGVPLPGYPSLQGYFYIAADDLVPD